jgi:hypothetical protein
VRAYFIVAKEAERKRGKHKITKSHSKQKEERNEAPTHATKLHGK